MTIFLRMLADRDKCKSLSSACAAVRSEYDDNRIFELVPNSFKTIPGAPFAYWVSDMLRGLFDELPAFECENRTAKQGLATADDGRFLRVWWEVRIDESDAKKQWAPLVKGGAPSNFFNDPYSVVKWHSNGYELKSFASWYRASRGWGDQWSAMINATEYYFKPGFTWPLRSTRFAPSAMPAGCAFSTRGCAGIVPKEDLPWLISFMASSSFDYLFKLRLGRFGHPEFTSGALQAMPIPEPGSSVESRLSELFFSAWSLKCTVFTTEETSHYFLLPAALRTRQGNYDRPTIEAELERIQAEIDAIAFDLFGFSDADRAATLGDSDALTDESEAADHEAEDEDSAEPIDQKDGLLSWTVGVAFSRFDWRLATGERAAPPEPEPFDPLPAKSPGMLPNDAGPFHAHPGILVDDKGHPHDLARLIEEVLARVDVPAPSDIRRWLLRDFFPFHLKQYSKSRRKAPTYWPLSTASGGYTLWVYYPALTNQTLYSAVNDFVEPKLKQVSQTAHALHGKSGRNRAEDKELEALTDMEAELKELRDSLLDIARDYAPNHDDGVQITAAPLWPLFRHKPWQKILKDTWKKLEKGDYDWAHLAMAYWPDRVREKCKTDKSLAIAHGLEELYVEPEVTLNKGKKGSEDDR